MEIWIDIAEFPNYQVSDLGRVVSKRSLYFINPSCSANKYWRVHLRREGKSYQVSVHELVAVAFLQPLQPDCCYIIHLDGNFENNAANNLEWVTYREYAEFYSIPKNRQYVRIIESDEIFETAAKCAKSLEVPRASVSRALRTNRSVRGLHVEYI